MIETFKTLNSTYKVDWANQKYLRSGPYNESLASYYVEDDVWIDFVEAYYPEATDPVCLVLFHADGSYVKTSLVQSRSNNG